MGPTKSNKKYIGNKVISGTFDLPLKTALGEKVLTVSFEDGTQTTLTEKSYNRMITDTETDATNLRKLKCEPVVQEILVLMQEANLTMGEVNFVIELTALSIDKNASDAMNKIFKVEYPEDRTLLSIDALLKGNEPIA